MYVVQEEAEWEELLAASTAPAPEEQAAGEAPAAGGEQAAEQAAAMLAGAGEAGAAAKQQEGGEAAGTETVDGGKADPAGAVGAQLQSLMQGHALGSGSRCDMHKQCCVALQAQHPACCSRRSWTRTARSRCRRVCTLCQAMHVTASGSVHGVHVGHRAPAHKGCQVTHLWCSAAPAWRRVLPASASVGASVMVHVVPGA